MTITVWWVRFHFLKFCHVPLSLSDIHMMDLLRWHSKGPSKGTWTHLTAVHVRAVSSLRLLHIKCFQLLHPECLWGLLPVPIGPHPPRGTPHWSGESLCFSCCHSPVPSSLNDARYTWQSSNLERQVSWCSWELKGSHLEIITHCDSTFLPSHCVAQQF